MAKKGGRPPKYETAKAFRDKCREYFDNGGRKTAGGSMLYTVSGLCIYLDICRDTLSEYAKDDRFSDTIKKAKLRIENCVEELSLIGGIDKTSAIFNLKNNFGWKDKDRDKRPDSGEGKEQIIINFGGATTDE